MQGRKPTNLMRKTAASLFPESGEEQDAFLQSLLSPEPRGNAVVWTVPRRAGELNTMDRSLLPEWLPNEVELLKAGEKPGLLEAFEKGDFYSLDYSSVLTGSALLALRSYDTNSWNVLDLCASPGGKSILASLFLRPGMLLANEVEGKRLGMLRHNLKRCRIPNSFTQRMRPNELAEKSPESFQLGLVDAPCSGQSLLAKGRENPGCFHPSTVKGNARRQLRILREASKLICAGGFLFYSTCTFHRRENEGVIEKFLASHDDYSSLPLSHLDEFASPLSEQNCYRIYPHRTPGAGGFVSLLRRKGDLSINSSPSVPKELLVYPVEDDSSVAG